MKTWLACVLVVAATGCPDVSKDTNETPGPSVEFDPANSIVPFPNNIVLDPTTGKVKLAMSACESPTATAIRTGVLNTLDGFGTYEVALQVTLTEAADPATVAGNVVLFKVASGMTPVDPTSAQPVPVFTTVNTTLRFDPANCAAPAMVAAIDIVPLVPLDEKSTYVYAILDGLKTANGTPFLPSPTWALVRQPADPVTLDDMGNVVSDRTPLVPGQDANGNGIDDTVELQGLDGLWKLHAPLLMFLAATNHMPGNILVAAGFNTQTTTDPLDPAVASSPASTTPTTPLGLMISVPTQDGVTAEQFLTAALPPGTCNAIPCNAVGDIFGGHLTSPSYQVLGPNPLAGGAMVPGPWSDPVHPMVVSPTQSLEFIAAIPKSAPPAGGYPLVVFGHGLGSAKETLAVFAPQLAAAGFASIAIDFQAHGSRAVRESIDPAIGCAGHCAVATTMACDGFMANCPANDTCLNGAGQAIAPTVTQQCYAPFLSTDLATTRDNIRQTVLDLQRLIQAAKACGTAGCAAANAPSSVLAVDGAHIVYAGISLGGIIGSTNASVAKDLQAAVLNVPGVGLVDILENTASLAIRCPLVNTLIQAGILMGQLWDPAMPTVGLCTTDAWKMQPGYQQFASTARWVLDPADGANFTPKLAPKRFLIQEVVMGDGGPADQVVPNIATNNEGMLVGLTPATADPFTPVTPPPPTGASAAILANPMTSKWLQYPSLAPGPSTDGFGNLFQHASLLSPAPSAMGHCSNAPATTCMDASACGGPGVCIFPGQLGTARVQTDAITFLLANH